MEVVDNGKEGFMKLLQDQLKDEADAKFAYAMPLIAKKYLNIEFALPENATMLDVGRLRDILSKLRNVGYDLLPEINTGNKLETEEFITFKMGYVLKVIDIKTGNVLETY